MPVLFRKSPDKKKHAGPVVQGDGDADAPHQRDGGHDGVPVLLQRVRIG